MKKHPLFSLPTFRSPAKSPRAIIAAAVAAVALTGTIAGPAATPVANAQIDINDFVKSSYPPEGAGQPWRGPTPHIVSKTHVAGNHWRVDVWSPANRRVVTNNVLLPGGTQPRGTFYLLPGIEGGQEGMNWMTHSDLAPWFAGKNVNVVMPIGGRFSLFTDWNSPDPLLGINKWNTYMTRELPPLIDREFHGTGVDAIGGVSSTGGSALDIAAHAPQRFRAAASYSGCPIRSGAFGTFASTAMMAWGGGSSTNAWGVPESFDWRDHDPNRNPQRLRGVNVFVGSGNGNPGPIDRAPASKQMMGPAQVEQLADRCSNEFARNARAAGVNVNRYRINQGTHTFPLFTHLVKTSWAQTIQPTIGG